MAKPRVSLRDFEDAQAAEAIDRKAKQPKIKRETRGNIEVLTAESNTIRTVVDLLDACGVDRDCLKAHGSTEFVVTRSDARKYDSIFGMREGDKKTPIVVPLWYVSATLQRRKAVATEWQPVEPLAITIRTPSKPTPPKREGLKRALILPDSQHGYFRNYRTGELEPTHDRRACDVALQVAHQLQPDAIVLLGDMLDLSDWSEKFVQGPEFAYMARYAGLDLAWWIAQLRALCPSATIDYIEGNHEARLPRLLKKNAAVAYALRPVDADDGPPLMSIEQWLGLDARGVRYHGPYPDGRVWLNENFAAVHGDKARNGSGKTTAAVVQDLQCSEIQGHIHRIEQAMKTTHPHRGPSLYAAYSPGTLARIDGAVPAATPRVNWQQGFAEATYEPGNGTFSTQLYPIIDGTCIHGGLKYIGSDYAERMSRDLKRKEFTEYEPWRKAA